MSRATLLQAFVWQLAGNWGTRVVTLLVFALLARWLGAEALGTMSYVLGLMMIVLAFADLALAEYLVYRQDAGPDVATAIWWLQTAGGSVMAIGIAAAAWFMPQAVVPTGIDPLLVVAVAATLPIAAAGKVPEALLRRHVGGFRTLALRSFAVAIAGAVVALPMAWAGHGVWSLVAKQWVESVVGLLLFFRSGSWRPSRAWRWEQTLEVLRRSWGMMGSRLLDLLAQRMDVMLIGWLLGMQPLGHYAVAQRLFQVLQGMVTGSVYTVVNSRLGALRGRDDELRRFVLRAATGAALAASLVYLMGLLAAEPLVHLFFGARWEASIPLLLILLLGALATAIAQTPLAGYVCFTQQDNLAVLLLYLLDLLLTVALLAFAARWGIEAVAAAGALKAVITGVLWWLRARNLLQLPAREWLHALVPAVQLVLPALAAWALVLALSSAPWSSWAAAGAALVLLSVSAPWLLRRHGARLAEVRRELHR